MDDIEVVQVTFRRKFNLGNYETEDVELVATVKEGQDPIEVLAKLDKYTVKYRQYQEAK